MPRKNDYTMATGDEANRKHCKTTHGHGLQVCTSGDEGFDDGNFAISSRTVQRRPSITLNKPQHTLKVRIVYTQKNATSNKCNQGQYGYWSIRVAYMSGLHICTSGDEDFDDGSVTTHSCTVQRRQSIILNKPTSTYSIGLSKF